jgi:hypothetical protein
MVMVHIQGLSLGWALSLKHLKVWTRTDQEARHWWLTPLIPATQEAEIRRLMI